MTITKMLTKHDVRTKYESLELALERCEAARRAGRSEVAYLCPRCKRWHTEPWGKAS